MSRLANALLPKGLADLLVQMVLLAVVIFAYQLTRGLADDGATAATAIDHARSVVAIERALGLYVEPSMQRWALGVPNLTDALSWIYLNVQTTLTLGGLLWIYARYNHAYYFVRNMFFVSFLAALPDLRGVPDCAPAAHARRVRVRRFGAGVLRRTQVCVGGVRESLCCDSLHAYGICAHDRWRIRASCTAPLGTCRLVGLSGWHPVGCRRNRKPFLA